MWETLVINSKDSDIEKRDLINSELNNKIQKTEAQYNIKPDVTTGFNRSKVIALFSCIDAEKCADILIKEILPYKDKGKPQKGLFPLYCAIKCGWLERPSYKEFNEAFPGVCENDASYTIYIPNKGMSKYETNPKKSFDIEAHCENMLMKLNDSTKSTAKKISFC